MAAGAAMEMANQCTMSIQVLARQRIGFAQAHAGDNRYQRHAQHNRPLAEQFIETDENDRQRKLDLVLPYDGEPDPRGYYGLTQRNYIEADSATGLAGYGDMRYVALSGASIDTEGK